MENKTIEERAIEYAFGKHCVRICTDSNGNNVVWKCSNLEDGCSCFPFDKTCEQFVEIVTEQDRIARAEERERCIKAAQEIVCKMCYEDSAIGCKYANDVAKCTTLIRLRKAMEGGEE